MPKVGSLDSAVSDLQTFQTGFLAAIAAGDDGQALIVDSAETYGLNVTDFPSAGDAIPSGVVSPYALSSAPSGWLLCDGSAVSRATYSALFAAIGTTYGVGDGSTTFNVPDLRGRLLVCMDDLGSAAGAADVITAAWADSLGGTGGAESHTLTSDEIPSHTHPVPARNSVGGGTAGLQTSTGQPDVTINTNATGGGNAHNNIQPSFAMGAIIKT